MQGYSFREWYTPVSCQKTQEHKHHYHAIVLETVDNKNPGPVDRKVCGSSESQTNGNGFKVLRVAADVCVCARLVPNFDLLEWCVCVFKSWLFIPLDCCEGLLGLPFHMINRSSEKKLLDLLHRFSKIFEKCQVGGFDIYLK